jgi:hypothetical protein
LVAGLKVKLLDPPKTPDPELYWTELVGPPAAADPVITSFT